MESVEIHTFSSVGEAIVVEHLAHGQVSSVRWVVPPDLKFPGHTEVFAEKPNVGLVNRHPTLLRFRSGARWDPNLSD